MPTSSKVPTHPGAFVREHILTPKHLTVAQAAKQIGLSRPNFSRFLNGHSPATQNIASRIERAFGFSAQKLLNLQDQYDAQIAPAHPDARTASPYVAPFLNFKANDIIAYFTSGIAPRSQLAVFLRRLVHSSAIPLEKVDFPGNDDAERPGSDGVTQTPVASPWIPQGSAVWEFGVTDKISKKADGDFDKSVKAMPRQERLQTTFIFVTPQRWTGKSKWIREKKAQGEWLDVRAYDASDLEQWLEQSPAAQVWLAEKTGTRFTAVRTLLECWNAWAQSTTPPLDQAFFRKAAEQHKAVLASFLSAPAPASLTITADSAAEALAFLSCAMKTQEFQASFDRTVVFDSPAELNKMALGNCKFIAVVHTPEVRREAAPLMRQLKTIVYAAPSEFRPGTSPEICLGRPDHTSFCSALQNMGKTPAEASQLSAACGYSLTVLRRHLSQMPAIATPPWAEDEAKSKRLIPFALAGSWDKSNENDLKALEQLSGQRCETLQEWFASLLMVRGDSPVWSSGTRQGVVSAMDCFFAIAPFISESSLRRFFTVAAEVLSEDDPSLSLPADEQWRAGTQGIMRRYSDALRGGLSQTLALIAVHGQTLFGNRLELSSGQQVNSLVRKILHPASARVLAAQESELPLYAEASPEVFLSVLEEDLSQPAPTLEELMKPSPGAPLTRCPRAGLLHALEILAWAPATFMRSVHILARLAQKEPNDGWGNSPLNSLKNIFRHWMPQTDVDQVGRVHAIEILFKDFPDVGWTLCMDALDPFGQTGCETARPIFRIDGLTSGEPVKSQEGFSHFLSAIKHLVLSRPCLSASMLCDLIERLPSFSKAERARFWAQLSSWRSARPGDENVALVRERIRSLYLASNGASQETSPSYRNLIAESKRAFDLFSPENPVYRHQWLFASAWIDDGWDDESQTGMEHIEAQEKRIEKKRVEALRDIIRIQGLSGLLLLASGVPTARIIGCLTAKKVLPSREVTELLALCLRHLAAAPAADHVAEVIRGILIGLSDKALLVQFKRLEDNFSEDALVTLMLLSPCTRLVWSLVDRLPEVGQQRYWQEVTPIFSPNNASETEEGMRRLLRAERPQAAFMISEPLLEVLPPELIAKTLMTMAHAKNQEHLSISNYYIHRAFSILNKSKALSLEEMANLEFAHLEALSTTFPGETKQRIPNLEQFVASQPEFYAQLICWAYKPKHREVAIAQEEVPGNLALRAAKLLHSLRQIPGLRDSSREEKAKKLNLWIDQVRAACSKADRLAVAELSIGHLLAYSDLGEDGVWPCEPVRDVVEQLRSPDIFEGMRTGKFNARGLVWRSMDDGGRQERELAAQYQSWAEQLQITHPHLSAKVLTPLEEQYERLALEQDTQAEVWARQD